MTNRRLSAAALALLAGTALTASQSLAAPIAPVAPNAPAALVANSAPVAPIAPSATVQTSPAGPAAAAAPAAQAAAGQQPDPGTPGGVDLVGMDRSVKPGDDFWSYANGGFKKANPIPADRSFYGASTLLSDESNARVKAVIQAAAKAPAGSEQRKIADAYASFMDEAGIEARGTAPLKPQLAAVAAIADKRALSRFLGGQMRADVDALNNTNFFTDNLFGFWASPAFDDTSVYAPYLLQGGLTLPDRDYYLAEGARNEAIRTAYRAHVEKMLTLAGQPDAAAKADRVVALETAIARVHATRAESADVAKTGGFWTPADFTAKAPGIDWGQYWQAAGLTGQKRFSVWHMKAVTGESALVASVPLQDWKDYLTFHVVQANAPFLSKAFVDQNFEMFGKTLNGTPAMQPRERRAIGVTNNMLGEAVGREYVKTAFPVESKAAVQQMVDSIKAAFVRRVDALDWMAPATKAEAKKKIETMAVGVGYPDKWRDYSALAIRPDDIVGNVERYELFNYRQMRARLGQPVDRSEWVMTPQTVNAVNLPMLNALNFPAAHLQPPSFDPKATAAVNYGSFGSVIGHEISHSFDDGGAQFDSSGRLRNWWTDQDLKRFKQAGDALVAQFDAYRPFPDAKVNGRLTLNENIADVAGLAAAHDAWIASLGGKPAPTVGGLTGEQQFYLAFAQGWRTYGREAAARQRLVTDGHAPAEYRAATVRNLDSWYPAFAVKDGDALYLAPKDRVKVW